MKTRPILFSTPMVQAILNGTKTQTRRIKGLEKHNVHPNWWRYDGQAVYDDQVPCYNHYMELLDLDGTPREMYDKIKCTVKRGDIFWVRETFYKTTSKYLNGLYYYKASIDEGWDLKWKPSIFMPKDACRIWLKVTNVRVERLKDISENDAIAEGIKKLGQNGFNNTIYKNYPSSGSFENGLENPKDSFFSLWESINGIEPLNANPWVWVYEFERCEMPKDFLK